MRTDRMRLGTISSVVSDQNLLSCYHLVIVTLSSCYFIIKHLLWGMVEPSGSGDQDKVKLTESNKVWAAVMYKPGFWHFIDFPNSTVRCLTYQKS